MTFLRRFVRLRFFGLVVMSGSGDTSGDDPSGGDASSGDMSGGDMSGIFLLNCTLSAGSVVCPMMLLDSMNLLYCCAIAGFA